jgi:hypothetical protein
LGGAAQGLPFIRGSRHRLAARAWEPPEFDATKATARLNDLGQSLWLDNITRDLLTTGTLKRYIDELSVTGLTSNPTIFDHAIKPGFPICRPPSADHASGRCMRQASDGLGRPERFATVAI